MPVIYPPRVPGHRRLAWPERHASPPSHSSRLPPAAVQSAEANLRELDLSGWRFARSRGEEENCVEVSLALTTLVRLLTTRGSDAERLEWARRLVLQAQEELPDASLRHLWTSLGRESWEAARLRQKREQAEAAKPPSPTFNQPIQPTAVTADSTTMGLAREELAAELMHFTAMLRKAIPRTRGSLATKAETPPEPQLEASDIVPDVLRAGKASFSSLDGSSSGGGGGLGASQYAEPINNMALVGGGYEAAIRYCQPLWAAPEGGDGSRLQATLRFEPGVAHGDTVLVVGPDGEQMPLLTPPGVRNVQRVLASVVAPLAAAARAPEGTKAGSRLLIDIVPLGPNAAPLDKLSVDGVNVILPSYAAPFTSLVLALPVAGGRGGRAQAKPKANPFRSVPARSQAAPPPPPPPQTIMPPSAAEAAVPEVDDAIAACESSAQPAALSADQPPEIPPAAAMQEVAAPAAAAIPAAVPPMPAVEEAMPACAVPASTTSPPFRREAPCAASCGLRGYACPGGRQSPNSSVLATPPRRAVGASPLAIRAAPAPPPPAPPPPADPPPPPLEEEENAFEPPLEEEENAFEQQQLQDTVFEDSPMQSSMDSRPDSPFSVSASEEDDSALVSGADWQVES